MEHATAVWTITIVKVSQAQGILRYTEDGERVALQVASTASAEDFLSTAKKALRKPGLALLDLQPFDKAAMGRRAGHYGAYTRGFTPEDADAWVPKYPGASGPNCRWQPSIDDPTNQTIAEAGLCDGAELAVAFVYAVG